jgi:hypothetical protein
VIAEAAATNIRRHSVHLRRIPRACPARGLAVRVDHDPAAATARITRPGGSRSRREMDLYKAAAEALQQLGGDDDDAAWLSEPLDADAMAICNAAASATILWD